ncbi:MAG: SGNH/GDSL hydrolase family protein [Rikenellaceae bacterium]
MRRIFLALTLICVSITSTFAQLKWYNPQQAEANPLEGQYWKEQERANFYNRFPDSFEEKVRPALWKLSTNSAGLVIRFRTNSPTIKVRYVLSSSDYSMHHMPSTGVSGLDMYSYDSEGKVKRMVGGFHFSDTTTYDYNVTNFSNAPSDKGFEYEMTLPTYNGVKWLSIGVKEDSFFQFSPVREELPIVAYGTSITQGACASRPGMAWTSILSREMDMPLYNFGFSGNGQLEDALIDMIIEIDAAIYILDCMPNLQYTPINDLTELICKQVKRIREKRPTTPILLADHLGYSNRESVTSQNSLTMNTVVAQKNAFNALKEEGVENIYHLDFESLNMPTEALVDYVHPSDYGMLVYAKAYEKELREILNMPKGDQVTTIGVRQRREPATYEWMSRHNDIINQSKSGNKTNAFIGNSIVHQWGGVEGFSVQRADEIWSDNLSSYLNMGCGWDRIENVLWRVEHGELDFQTFETIILKIGTNNLSVKHSDEQILAGLANLVEVINAKQSRAKILLAGILPRRDMETRVKSLNQKIKQLTTKYNYIEYIDLSEGLLLENGKLNEQMYVDGLHPNSAGYAKIAASLKSKTK